MRAKQRQALNTCTNSLVCPYERQHGQCRICLHALRLIKQRLLAKAHCLPKPYSHCAGMRLQCMTYSAHRFTHPFFCLAHAKAVPVLLFTSESQAFSASSGPKPGNHANSDQRRPSCRGCYGKALCLAECLAWRQHQLTQFVLAQCWLLVLAKRLSKNLLLNVRQGC